jgi:hypothetical protein
LRDVRAERAWKHYELGVILKKVDHALKRSACGGNVSSETTCE